MLLKKIILWQESCIIIYFWHLLIGFAGLLFPGQSMSNPSLQRHLCGEKKEHFLNTRALQSNVQLQWNSIVWRKTLNFTTELRTPMGSKCNCNGTLSWPKYVQSLCLICGATQGNKAALAENLTQAFCQRPWLRKKRDFFFSISYRSWKGQLRRGTSMLADVEYL